jgi:hypothetical protein
MSGELYEAQFRADFVSEVVKLDDESGIVWMRFLPDPRRYEEIQKDGETLYIDRYMRTAFRIEDFAGQMGGLPFHHLQRHIDAAGPYADSRRAAIRSELTSGQYVPPEEGALSHQELSDEGGVRKIGFISVDICGATALRKADATAFDLTYKFFLQELGAVVGQFNGAILKTKGDGFISLCRSSFFHQLMRCGDRYGRHDAPRPSQGA